MSFFEHLDQAGGFYYEVSSPPFPTPDYWRYGSPQACEVSPINTALGRCARALHCRSAISAA